jgi:hypothetical protein
MRHLCEQLATELKDGPWQSYFLNISSKLQNYTAAVEEGTELPLTNDLIKNFDELAHALRQLPNMVAPSEASIFIRTSSRAIDSLVSLSTLFDDPRSILPWNGMRIVEALTAFKKSFGEKTPTYGQRYVISYENLEENFKGLEISLRVAITLMRKELEGIS